jgi:hypothetical protein
VYTAGNDPCLLVENHLANWHLTNWHLADRYLTDICLADTVLGRYSWLVDKSLFVLYVHWPNVCQPNGFWPNDTQPMVTKSFITLTAGPCLLGCRTLRHLLLKFKFKNWSKNEHFLLILRDVKKYHFLLFLSSFLFPY